MIDRYLRDVQGARHRLAPVGSDLRSRRSRPGENRASRRCKPERLAPVMSDLRSRRSRMAGSVNTGSYWRDRGPGARPTALHRSGAICDYADRGRRRRFAAVATQALADLKPIAAARLARDIDHSSKPPTTQSAAARATGSTPPATPP